MSRDIGLDMIVTYSKSVLSGLWPVQITCYGDGEDAAQPEESGGELQQYTTKC